MRLSIATEDSVPIVIRARGNAYQRSGRVKLDKASGGSVVATVQGSRRYQVDLKLDGRQVRHSCTCPYADGGAVCKHIWATILAAEPAGFALYAAKEGPLRLKASFEETESRNSTGSKKLPSTDLDGGWRSFDALLEAVQNHQTVPYAPSPVATGGRRTLYVIDPKESESRQKLVLELFSQSTKKNGEWGPITRYSSSLSANSPLDREIYSYLSGAERTGQFYYHHGQKARYHISGSILDPLLSKLAETGRVYVSPDPNRVEMVSLSPDIDPPWEVNLVVRREPHQYTLVGNLRRGEERLACEAVDLLIPGLLVWQGKWGRIQDHNQFNWLRELRRHRSIPIPLGRESEFLSRLVTTRDLPQLELPTELQYREVTVAPNPFLTIIKPKVGSSTFLHADAAFEYSGRIVSTSSPNRGVFVPQEKIFLLRDLASEESALQQLLELGMTPRPFTREGEPKYELKTTQLAALVRELIARGWKVEAEGKLYRSSGKLQLAVKSDRDWFDLQGAVSFGESSIAFPQLLEALRSGARTVDLDDGSVGMLPEEWLERYGLLSRMGTVTDDGLRFSRAQVGVLDALLSSRPEVSFDRQLARAREQLRKFQSVTPSTPPKSFQGELREYQREGLGWLKFLRRFGFGGCLADDMGLGKTVQVLAWLACKRNGPALVVVPRSLVFNWKREAARFTPKLKVLDHTGPGRDKSVEVFQEYDLVLTTYGILRLDAEIFAQVHFDTCILDESQAAKNADTETSKAVRVIQADHRLAMSGTPVENHLGELWTLFDFLNPGMLGAKVQLSQESLRNPDAETKEVLVRALRPFILRRTKNQVAKDLPSKSEQILYCDLEPEQRRYYNELRDYYRDKLLTHIDAYGMKRSKIQVLEALLRLRQAACHPGLIDRRRSQEPSAKLEILLPQLRDLAESSSKTLIFSQFTSFLSIVQNRFEKESFTYEYLDGSTRDRAARVERFQNDPKCQFFLISLKAGGVGLNLTAAEYVFLLDPWWNPAVEAQAIDRSHRIGQTKPVFAYRLIARGTVEEKVLALQQSKRKLAESILSGDGRPLGDLTKEDLEALLS